MNKIAKTPRSCCPTPPCLARLRICGRSQAGVSSTGEGGLAAAKAIVADEGVGGLYTGYTSNIAYAFPADAIKFLVSMLRGSCWVSGETGGRKVNLSG